MPEPAFDSLPATEIREFDRVLRAALLNSGGFEFVMRAEADRAVRTREIEPLLDSLGIFELDPSDGEDQLQAAATAARVAGLYALPYPVAERLAGNLLGIASPDDPARPPVALTVVDGQAAHLGERLRVNQADLPFDWRAIDVTSGRTTVIKATGATGGRLGPFVAEVVIGESSPTLPAALPLALLLPSFTLLGMLDSALDLTRDHVNDREQFGAPIVTFQAVQHQLADALIAFQLFEQQAYYALWSVSRERASALVDVAGARLSGLHAADKVLRVAHQLHGATGFADESAISWLSRHSQPLRRLPLSLARTEGWFTRLVMRSGFDGLFTAMPAEPDTAQGGVGEPVPESGAVHRNGADPERAARLATQVADAAHVYAGNGEVRQGGGCTAPF